MCTCRLQLRAGRGAYRPLKRVVETGSPLERDRSGRSYRAHLRGSVLASCFKSCPPLNRNLLGATRLCCRASRSGGVALRMGSGLVLLFASKPLARLLVLEARQFLIDAFACSVVDAGYLILKFRSDPSLMELLAEQVPPWNYRRGRPKLKRDRRNAFRSRDLPIICHCQTLSLICGCGSV